MDEHLLTVEQVANLLRCAPDLVYSHIRSGRLPAINISHGKRPLYRITQADFDRYKASAAVVIPSEPESQAVARTNRRVTLRKPKHLVGVR